MAIIMKMNKRYELHKQHRLKMRYKDGKTNVDERSVAEDERLMTLPKEGFSVTMVYKLRILEYNFNSIFQPFS